MIEFINVTKKYNDKLIIKGINIKINKGEFVSLIGPSGSGKTTTVKMINKLITPTSGEILIDGRNISEINSIKLRRSMGYVIQQIGLFPHMTVRENISLIPRIEKIDKGKIYNNVKKLLRIIGMNSEEFLDKYPNQLSGGQQQRVGIARAFAMSPEIVLMDEPFSALDPITRNELQNEVLNIQQKFKKTIVFVTHDMNEALKLSDRICIIKDGSVVQYDTPNNILTKPINSFVEDFVGKNEMHNRPELMKVKDIMIKNESLKDAVKNDSIKINENDTVLDALKLIQKEEVEYITVVDNDMHALGIVNKSCLLSIFYKQFVKREEENFD